MDNNDTGSKLENIIKGVIIEGAEDNCTTIRNLLCGRFSTSTTVKKDFEGKSIIKEKQANDGIYYATWLEFFNSIVIHNLLFSNTAYTFLGFIETENTLKAVLKQPFITSDDGVDLSDVRKLLAFNGFENRLRKGVPTNN